MPDDYSPYEVGVDQLLKQIGRDCSHYHDALVYEQRLKENIDQSRRFGDSETRRSERSEIVCRLNELAVSVLDVSFNTLCSSAATRNAQETELSHIEEKREQAQVVGLEYEDLSHDGDSRFILRAVLIVVILALLAISVAYLLSRL
jgi:hypothetical protein